MCNPPCTVRPDPGTSATFWNGVEDGQAARARFFKKAGDKCKAGFQKAADCIGLGKKAGTAKEAGAGEKARAETVGSNEGKE